MRAGGITKARTQTLCRLGAFLFYSILLRIIPTFVPYKHKMTLLIDNISVFNGKKSEIEFMACGILWVCIHVFIDKSRVYSNGLKKRTRGVLFVRK